MNESLILTKESVPSDIERYFRGVLALDQQDKVFSVNLDDVWQLVYSERGKAVKALKQNFIDNVDYISIAQSGKTATGGFKKIDYYLTSACLEYFVARKVRPVFEVYRRVFHHAVAQVQQPSLQEQIQANLTFADWAIKTLNINEASKLGWAKKISDKFGLAAELPDAVNAGTEKPITHAATDLLKSHNVGISAQAFNRMLELKGVVKHAILAQESAERLIVGMLSLLPSTSTDRISKTRSSNSRRRYVGMTQHSTNYLQSLDLTDKHY